MSSISQGSKFRGYNLECGNCCAAKKKLFCNSKGLNVMEISHARIKNNLRIRKIIGIEIYCQGLIG